MSLTNLNSLGRLGFNKGKPRSNGLAISAPASLTFADADQPYTMGAVWPPANTVLYIDFDNDIYYWDGAFQTLADLTDNGDGTYDLDLSTTLDPGNLSGFIEHQPSSTISADGCPFNLYDSGLANRFELSTASANGATSIYTSSPAQYTAYTATADSSEIGYKGRRIRTMWSYSAGSPIILFEGNATSSVNANAASLAGGNRIGIGYRRRFDDQIYQGTIHKICLINAAKTEAQLQVIQQTSDLAKTYNEFWVGDSFLNGSKIRWDVEDIRQDTPYRFTGQYNVGATTLAQQATDFTTNRSRYYGMTLIICEHLEYATDPTGSASIAAIQSMVDELSHDRWLYVQSNPTEITGTSGRDDFDAADAAIRAYVGETHYVETLPTMQAANDGSAQDLTDVANDIWPDSLRSDSIHPNTAGDDILAGLIRNKLIANGWNTKTTPYIQLSDSKDDGTGLYSPTFTISAGTMTLASNSLAFDAGDGVADATFTINSETLVEINAALRGMTFDTGTDGSATITIENLRDSDGKTTTKIVYLTATAPATPFTLLDGTTPLTLLDGTTELTLL